MAENPESKVCDEAPPLSSEFHRARRQLMFWSGLLFAWELVGLDLEEIASSSGNIGIIVKAIKSPQAIPWIIIILVAYFLYRITVEWWQSPGARRDNRVSKFDLWFCWGTAGAVYALYLGQWWLNIRFADILDTKAEKGEFALGLFIGFLFVNGLAFALRYALAATNRTLSFRAIRISVRAAVIILLSMILVMIMYAFHFIDVILPINIFGVSIHAGFFCIGYFGVFYGYGIGIALLFSRFALSEIEQHKEKGTDVI
jgi:hypothetical protein